MSSPKNHYVYEEERVDTHFHEHPLNFAVCTGTLRKMTTTNSIDIFSYDLKKGSLSPAKLVFFIFLEKMHICIEIKPGREKKKSVRSIECGRKANNKNTLHLF